MLSWPAAADDLPEEIDVPGGHAWGDLPIMRSSMGMALGRITLMELPIVARCRRPAQPARPEGRSQGEHVTRSRATA